jgi:hypothetical protein
VFAIASAGCTARVLAAAGYRVAAVDINPRQLAYARARAGGGPIAEGAAERLVRWGRRGLTVVGWSRARLDEFLALSHTGEQTAYWRDWLDTRWLGGRLRQRLYRCCSIHPNRTNPYLRALLRGDPIPEPEPVRYPIEFVCADAAAYLESCAPASFDGFTLSNIGDGASRRYMDRLRAAVWRASAPGAVSVLRSFGKPRTADDERWAAQDRGAIWGRIHVSA